MNDSGNDFNTAISGDYSKPIDSIHEFLHYVTETAAAVAPEYPGIRTVSAMEQLAAIRSSYEGLRAANSDCRIIINYLRQRCGLDPDGLVEIWEQKIAAHESANR